MRITFPPTKGFGDSDGLRLMMVGLGSVRVLLERRPHQRGLARLLPFGRPIQAPAQLGRQLQRNGFQGNALR